MRVKLVFKQGSEELPPIQVRFRVPFFPHDARLRDLTFLPLR
jgi:hypothetical protein